MGQIKILDTALANKIAAGEVIDRPFSLIRELMDNAIDADPTEITVYVDGGGIQRVRVVDNGRGMDRQDLEICTHTHATSKIHSLEDLFQLRTLGFRGEALASISAAARLEIISRTLEAETAFRLRHSGSQLLDLAPVQGNRGTAVEVTDLFYNVPARRKFLKRTSSEAAQCKRHFIEKALPFTDISFRYFQDGEMKLFLPSGPLTERIATVYGPEVPEKSLALLETTEEHYSLKVVAADISIHRHNRQLIQVFINNRRIEEYSLTQAVQYGYDEYLPGGAFPVCFVFINIDPSLVDFNVHPAKKEARFRNLPQIHHSLTRLIKGHFSSQYGKGAVHRLNDIPVRELFSPPENSPVSPNWTKQSNFTEQPVRAVADRASIYQRPSSFDIAEFSKETTPESYPVSDLRADDFLFIGQFAACYLLAEKQGDLYLIDQHAAHERILFDRFSSNSPRIQQLLIPIEWETDEDESRFLDEIRESLAEIGFNIESSDEKIWKLISMPEAAARYGKDIVELISLQTGSFEEIRKELFATMACKAAVKEGEVLDRLTAMDLIRQAFALDKPRCPHGRPLWFVLPKKELDGLVGRIVE